MNTLMSRATLALCLLITPAAFAEVQVKPYGFMKLDLAYDMKATTPGNFALLVPAGAKDSDGHFMATANQSRFGFAMKADAAKGVSTNGKLELDLYGSGKDYINANGQAAPRLRHAYGVVRWEDSDLELMAGQFWDLLSPNLPTLVNFGVQWKSGNLGFRRPQLRVTKGIKTGGKNRITVAAALSENSDGAGMSTMPVAQGRFGLEVGKLKVGVSGHYGKEQVAGETELEDFATWSGVLDVIAPINAKIVLKLEAWFGENTHAYMGNTGPEQKSFGGWAALGVQANKRLSLNVGFAMEKAEDDEKVAPEGIKQNMSGYANVFYGFAPNAKVALEGSYWKTEYADALDEATAQRVAMDAEDNIRGQLAFIFSF